MKTKILLLLALLCALVAHGQQRTIVSIYDSDGTLYRGSTNLFYSNLLAGVGITLTPTNNGQIIITATAAGITTNGLATTNMVYTLISALSNNVVAADLGKMGTNAFQTGSNVYAFGLPRTLTNVFAHRINVKDLGAVGDGSFDNWPIIQTAVSNFVTNGQSPVTFYFPRGNYRFSKQLTIPTTEYIKNAEITLEGVNYDASALYFTNATGAGIFVQGNPSHPSYIVLKDLSIFGPAQQYYSGAYPPYYSNLASVPFSTVGLYCGTNSPFDDIGSGMSGYEIRLERVSISDFYDGVALQNIGDVHMFESWIDSNARSNVRFKHCDSTTVRNGHFSRLLCTNWNEEIANFFVIGSYTNASFEEDGGAGGHIFDNIECHDRAIVARDTKIHVRGGQFEGLGSGGGIVRGDNRNVNSNGLFQLEGYGSYVFEGCQLAPPGYGVTNVIFNTRRSASAGLIMINCTYGSVTPENNYHETLGQFHRVFRINLDTNNPIAYLPHWSGGKFGPGSVQQSTNFYNLEIVTNGVKTLVHVEPDAGDTIRARYVQDGATLNSPTINSPTISGWSPSFTTGLNVTGGGSTNSTTNGFVGNAAGLTNLMGVATDWNHIIMRDEFLGGDRGTETTTGWGELGWHNKGTVTIARWDTTRWGTLRMRTAATTTNWTAMSLAGYGDADAIAPIYVAWANPPWEADFVFLLYDPASGGSASTNQVVATVGLLNRYAGNVGAYPSSTDDIGGIFAQYHSASNSVWRFGVMDGTRKNWANSTITATPDTWHKLRIRCLTAYTLEFSIDGENWVTITDGSLSASAAVNTVANPTYFIHTLTTTEKNMYLDYFGLWRRVAR